MDVIKEEPNLEEGPTQATPMKEEPLIDIKYEEHSDPMSPTVFVSPEMKFFDAIKLEPNSNTESDPIDMKHEELAFPVTTPAHLKSEEMPQNVNTTSQYQIMQNPQKRVNINMEEVLGFAADGHDVMSEEHGCCNASQHIFTPHQYGGSTTEHLLQQTVTGVSECEILGICKKGCSWSRNQQTDLHVDSVKKSLTNSDCKSQTVERAFTCKICSKVFSYKCNLKRHIRVHNGVKSFKCDICGKVFLERGGMKHHLRTHTGEKPSKCYVCGKAFSNNGNLKSHMRTHTGEKPFKCDACGRAFSNNGSLKHHTHTHTGEKPFKCDMCGKLFSLSWNLKYHIRTHLSEKPFK